MGEKRAAQTEAEETKDLVITNLKKIIMEDNREQTNRKIRKQGPDSDRSIEETSHDVVQGNPGHQRGSANLGGASGMDEKSSGLGRRDKGTGLSTKDGLTGSDYDGQLTE